MKKYLFGFLFLILCYGAKAQQPHIASGYVLDSNQQGIAGIQVTLAEVRSGPIGTYVNRVFTDSNGYYADTISLHWGWLRTFIDIYIIDCHQKLILKSALYVAGTTSITNFDYCPAPTSGGTCKAKFRAQATSTNPYAYTFNNQSIGGSPAQTTFHWDFGDGNTSQQAIPTHSFSPPSLPYAYNVCLDISTQMAGAICTDSFCDSVVIRNSQPPGLCWDLNRNAMCDLSFEDKNRDGVCDTLDCIGGGSCRALFSWSANALVAQFTDQSSPSSLIYSWNMGDGSTSNQANPLHSYSRPDTYTVCLSITDTLTQCQNTFCQILRIGTSSNCIDPSIIDTSLNCPTVYQPVCGCDGVTYTNSCIARNYYGVTQLTGGPCSPQPCNALFTYSRQGRTYNFSDQSTGTNGFTYQWSFGDGSSSTVQNPTHTYLSNGFFRVCLIVFDSLTQCRDLHCETILVSNSQGPCKAMFRAQPIGTGPNSFAFNNLSTGGSPALTTYHWDFGDGNTSNLASPTHSYAPPSVPYAYNICLVMTSKIAGVICTSTFCDSLVIWNPQPPSMCWDLNRNAKCDLPFEDRNRDGLCNTLDCGPIGTKCKANYSYRLAVTQFGFGVYFTNKSLINGTNTTYSWSFGNGATSNAQSPFYRYSRSGTYNVCLTISDTVTGCVDTFCDSVIILPSQLCKANFNHIVNGAQAYFINGSRVSSRGTYSWDFGDGNTSSLYSPIHTYNVAQGASASFLVCLTITDTFADGTSCTNTYCDSLVVNRSGMSAYTVSGNVVKGNGGPALLGIAYLIKHDTVRGTLAAVDSQRLSRGLYAFTNVSAGKYLVKAGLLPSSNDYLRFLPTYHGNSTFWNFAQSINVSSNHQGVNVNLIAGNNPGGPVFISGNISQGAGFTQGSVGSPVPNVSVLLFDQAGLAISHALTDSNGNYGFDQVPYGSYMIHVEIEGKMSTPRMLTVSPTKPTISGMDFTVHSSWIALRNRTLIEALEMAVFPNPTKGMLNINFSSQKGSEVLFRLYNSIGQEVKTAALQSSVGINNYTLDIKDLKQGLYLIEALMDGKLYRSKIMKN